MNLPKPFIDKMKNLLGDEFEAFLDSYNCCKSYGLRINPLKNGGLLIPDDFPFKLTPVSFAKEGFYVSPSEHPGKHPLHEAGAYYIQEPSAMSVVNLLDPVPGDIVCDFCAAPGGKSTQISGRLMGQGLLVSNEIFLSRAKILSQNIERLGVTNCVVTNEPPDSLSEYFKSFFTKILVDAPCSGEGMFRKDDTAISEWSPKQVKICEERQEMILNEADKMLQPGGILVYSTCTFSPEEDELMIERFLDAHPNYTLENWRDFFPDNTGIEGGRFSTTKEFNVSNTMRLWPHKLNGEGHFAARLKKNTADMEEIRKKKTKKRKNSKIDLDDFMRFKDSFIKLGNQNTPAFHAFDETGKFEYFGDELYLVPKIFNSQSGLKIVRNGLHLGTRKKNRFEPSHSLAMALTPDDVFLSYDCNDIEALSFLQGKTLSCENNLSGWILLTYKNYSLGLGKATNGTIKNHYPKGLRLPDK